MKRTDVATMGIRKTDKGRMRKKYRKKYVFRPLDTLTNAHWHDTFKI
jgi:hypothetical protein